METEEAGEKCKKQESAAKRQQRIRQNSIAQSIEEVSQVFMSATMEGPDYICSCCRRLMYQKTVLEFEISKYPRAPEKCRDLLVQKTKCGYAKHVIML